MEQTPSDNPQLNTNYTLSAYTGADSQIKDNIGQNDTDFSSGLDSELKTLKLDQNTIMNVFPHLQRLIDVIQNKKSRIGVIIGAGVSVSAGFGAFRSDNELFKKVEQEYGDWPGRIPEQPDSFLEYALSFRSLMNDPRVLYRVLNSFQKVNQGYSQSIDQINIQQSQLLNSQDTIQQNLQYVQKKQIQATLTHKFLRLLADTGQLRRVVTQNIDGLEEAVGLRRILGRDLYQIHGSFGRPPSCVNPKCPLILLMRELKQTHYTEETHIKQNIKQLISQSHESFINSERIQKSMGYQYSKEKMVQPDSPHFSNDIHWWAVEDDAVLVCECCGCALKPAVVLYDEEVNLPQDAQSQMFCNMSDLLVLGTSLSVEPVNLLPPQIPPTASIHFVAKDLDLLRYFSDETNGIQNYQLLLGQRPNVRNLSQNSSFIGEPENRKSLSDIARRILSKNIISYIKLTTPQQFTRTVHIKHTLRPVNQPNTSQVNVNQPQFVTELQSDLNFELTRDKIDLANNLVEKYLNEVSDLLTFHKGESDVLFEKVLKNIPDLQEKYQDLEQQLQAEYVNQQTYPNYELRIKENHLQCLMRVEETPGNIVAQTQEVFPVLLAIPQLWTPDMALYWLDEKQKYAAAVLCLDTQVKLLLSIYAGTATCENFTFNGTLCKLFIAHEYKNDEYLDKAIYLPPGGHWGVYCLGYNAYKFLTQNRQYNQALDPWSLNFIGHQNKQIYYTNTNLSEGEFQYVGLWRQFSWALQNIQDMIIYQRNTIQVFANYERFIYPVLQQSHN